MFFFWPPTGLTKSQAHYKFLYLENFRGGQFKLYRAWDLVKFRGGQKKNPVHGWEVSLLKGWRLYYLEWAVFFLIGPDTIFTRMGSVFSKKPETTLPRMGSVLANMAGHYIY